MSDKIPKDVIEFDELTAGQVTRLGEPMAHVSPASDNV